MILMFSCLPVWQLKSNIFSDLIHFNEFTIELLLGMSFHYNEFYLLTTEKSI